MAKAVQNGELLMLENLRFQQRITDRYLADFAAKING